MGGKGSGRRLKHDRVCIYCGKSITPDTAYRKRSGVLMSVCKECNSRITWENIWKRKTQAEIKLQIAYLEDKMDFLKSLITRDTPVSREILNKEGYGDWTVKIIHSGGGLCVHSRKEIWIDETLKNDLCFFLHEVAHIEYPEHDVFWGDHYTKLLRKYVSTGVLTVYLYE